MAREIVKANVAVGFADLYTAPADTAKPADTIVYNGTFTGYESVGATDEGVAITFGRETTDHYVEEDELPALITVASATFNIETSLAEDTLESMQLAYGGGTIASSGTGATAKRTLALSSDLEELAVLIEAKTRLGHRRIYIPRVISAAEVGTPYRRSEAKRVYPVTLRSVCALADIDIDDFEPAA
jgi:hypothetical protein